MEMSLYQLYILKENMEKENLSNSSNYASICEKISNMELTLEEDGGGTSATGGPAGSVGGMGAVVNSQPSGLAGQTIGTNWHQVVVQLVQVIFQFLITQVVLIECNKRYQFKLWVKTTVLELERNQELKS